MSLWETIFAKQKLYKEKGKVSVSFRGKGGKTFQFLSEVFPNYFRFFPKMTRYLHVSSFFRNFAFDFGNEPRSTGRFSVSYFRTRREGDSS